MFTVPKAGKSDLSLVRRIIAMLCKWDLFTIVPTDQTLPTLSVQQSTLSTRQAL